MKRILLWVNTLLASSLLVPCAALAQPTKTFPWTYTLTSESSLTDECPICDRVPIVVPLRGTFQLRLLEDGPLFSSYSIDSVALNGGTTNGPQYRVTGKGTYRIGGEVAQVQELFLEVEIANASFTNLCFMTNSPARAVRGWPMLRVDAIQTNGTITQQYSFEIAAAPLREIWFSTGKGFHSQLWNAPTNWVSPGDLVASTGRIVKRNSELVGKLGFMPVVPDLGLKDFDVLPGGEIAFSMEQPQFSETFGDLTTGDLLGDGGGVLKKWSALLKPFSPNPLQVPPGLGAAQVQNGGEVYFSVQNGFFSDKLGTQITSTDLLSESGVVAKKGAQFLSSFALKDPSLDCGLAAVFVWPAPFQETWFFTRKGFTDDFLNHFAPGDLLSDRGYVVYRATELLAKFNPLEPTADVPMDGLFVVTDSTAGTSAVESKLSQPVPILDSSASVVIDWTSGSRVFQLEKAASAGGPFLPLSQIGTDRTFTDNGALTNSQGYYRLRTW
jgi:hypothetical protein